MSKAISIRSKGLCFSFHLFNQQRLLLGRGKERRISERINNRLHPLMGGVRLIEQMDELPNLLLQI